MGNNNVLGNTHLLTLAQNTQLDMNGFAQTLQNLSSAEGSLIDFNQGALTVNNGTVAGNLTGAGSLKVTGGSLSISSDNTGMTADTTIDEDGSVYMQATHALGSGSVSNSGNLVIGTDSADNNRPLPTGYQVGSLTNSGTVAVTHLAAGTQFQVNGNYTGQ
ncbi:TPA: autotransporter outer membrane beta-barrel domain-containing protein, partial [Morganella morganii]|nr:autotransporter outer membrane beta-barrel domain-containing protein [Morganella morganii]